MMTPLHIAALNSKEKIVKVVLLKDPNAVFKRNARGETPLDLARNNKNIVFSELFGDTPINLSDYSDFSLE